ncbi:MAG: DUF2384 domain-containing protein [Rhizobacter sp.]|nr:DUF2384 domain-containing protein [Rhizobacter sp.]
MGVASSKKLKRLTAKTRSGAKVAPSHAARRRPQRAGSATTFSAAAEIGGEHAAKVHAAIMGGVRFEALRRLLRGTSLPAEEVAQAVGLSTRTLRRRAANDVMPTEVASKAWLFADILAKASAVMGGLEAAEEWMKRPAIGLDGSRPLDLMKTIQGSTLVSEFLQRLEYGVYT